MDRKLSKLDENTTILQQISRRFRKSRSRGDLASAHFRKINEKWPGNGSTSVASGRKCDQIDPTYTADSKIQVLKPKTAWKWQFLSIFGFVKTADFRRISPRTSVRSGTIARTCREKKGPEPAPFLRLCGLRVATEGLFLGSIPTNTMVQHGGQPPMRAKTSAF